MTPWLNLRLEFSNKTKFRKFMEKLKSDNVLYEFVIEYSNDHVLFGFSSEEMQFYCYKQFIKSLGKVMIKTTSYGFAYLKIM